MSHDTIVISIVRNLRAIYYQNNNEERSILQPRLNIMVRFKENNLELKYKMS